MLRKRVKNLENTISGICEIVECQQKALKIATKEIERLGNLVNELMAKKNKAELKEIGKVKVETPKGKKLKEVKGE